MGGIMRAPIDTISSNCDKHYGRARGEGPVIRGRTHGRLLRSAGLLVLVGAALLLAGPPQLTAVAGAAAPAAPPLTPFQLEQLHKVTAWRIEGSWARDVSGVV